MHLAGSSRSAILAFSASVLLTACPLARATDYKLTSLDWAPYAAPELPGQGAVSTIVMAAFKAAGDTASVEFYPWNRAIIMARSVKGYVAYFPEYYSPGKTADFVYSAPVGISPLVFIERVAAPIDWADYDSLKGKKIGVVRGYLNTAELDAKLASGELTADEAPDDVKNLLKLVVGRVDLAVIDRNVFNHLARNDPRIRAVVRHLQINGKALADEKIYVCFRNTPEGYRALQDFNWGLARIDAAAIMKNVTD